MNAYNPGRAVILPNYLWTIPGIVDWTLARSVDYCARTVKVKARGADHVLSFEELDAAAQAVA